MWAKLLPCEVMSPRRVCQVISKKSPKSKKRLKHKKRELCTEEELEWYSNYMKMLIAHFSLPQAEEKITETTKQEYEDIISCWKNFISRISKQNSPSPDDPELHLEQESPPNPSKSIEEPEVDIFFQFNHLMCHIQQSTPAGCYPIQIKCRHQVEVRFGAFLISLTGIGL